MVATCVAPPPELPTAPLPDPVSHDNDDTYVRQYDEPVLIEESCTAPTPVQATVLEPFASSSIATPTKFQSCDHTPPKFQSSDHTPPVSRTAPFEPTAPAEADFWDVDDADDCDKLTWIANMAKAFPPGSLLDQTGRPVSPVDVRDFDTLDPISDYLETPSGSILDLVQV